MLDSGQRPEDFWLESSTEEKRAESVQAARSIHDMSPENGTSKLMWIPRAPKLH